MHVVLAWLIAAALAGDDVPSTILSRDGQTLWTAATDAVAAQRCTEMWSEPIGDFESSARKYDVSSIEGLADTSIAIYEGKVTALRSGFASENTGTLLRVRISKVVKPSSKIETAGDLLVFHAYARFTTPDCTFCVAIDPSLSTTTS
jgi:hypothetical protein